jgi:hypothetical protein
MGKPEQTRQLGRYNNKFYAGNKRNLKKWDY